MTGARLDLCAATVLTREPEKGAFDMAKGSLIRQRRIVGVLWAASAPWGAPRHPTEPRRLGKIEAYIPHDDKRGW